MGSSESTDAATQESEVSNLTTQRQQQFTNGVNRREFNNITTSNSTTQTERSTNYDPYREYDIITTSDSSDDEPIEWGRIKIPNLTTQTERSTNYDPHREFDDITTSNSSDDEPIEKGSIKISHLITRQQQQFTNDVTRREFDNITTSNSTTHTERSTHYDQHREFDTFATSNSTIKQRQSYVFNKSASNNLMKTNSSEVITKTLASCNDSKEILLAELTLDNTETPVVPIKRKNILHSIIKPPKKLNDLDDFIKNWDIWKEQLMSFLTLMDEKQLNHNQWGNFFLNFLGPFGQEILNELFFSKEEDKRNYEMLLQKYNAFYKFHTTLKSKSEDTVEYIEKLVGEVAQNFKNVDITIKNKIAQEIERNCKERFIALAISMLPKFKFETTFKSLTLAEIAFLWKNCEEYDFYSNRNCIYCGNFHQKGKCPASDNECSKCKRRGHAVRYCPGLMYITNCSFCGGNHKYKCCPSYGETCSKCGHFDHFSWKCSKATR